MFCRALENGEVQFFTERNKKKSSTESSDELLSVEDIGPQEEGDVVKKNTLFYYKFKLSRQLKMYYSIS